MQHRNLTRADFDKISKIPLLGAFSTSEIRDMTGRSPVRLHQSCDLLFSQGEPATRFFILLKGQVRLFRMQGDGRFSLFHMVSPGESFAEAVVLSGQAYPVSAECDPGSELVAFERAAIIAYLKQDARLIGRVMQSLIERERFFYREINQIRQRSPAQRLAQFLLSHPEKSRASIPKHIIASRIGVTPESFSRSLRKLEKSGFVAPEGDMRILDHKALRLFARTDGKKS
ncbi:MAG: Crp/Fnr family transcriptional regulator [Pseudomonadota bacterium]